MKHVIVSIYDTKGKTHNPPFFQRTVGEAERTFTKIVNDKNSIINQYPADFVLNWIGEFDDDNGSIESRPLQPLCTAAQVLESNSLLMKGISDAN